MTKRANRQNRKRKSQPQGKGKVSKMPRQPAANGQPQTKKRKLNEAESWRVRLMQARQIIMGKNAKIKLLQGQLAQAHQELAALQAADMDRLSAQEQGLMEEDRQAMGLPGTFNMTQDEKTGEYSVAWNEDPAQETQKDDGVDSLREELEQLKAMVAAKSSLEDELDDEDDDLYDEDDEDGEGDSEGAPMEDEATVEAGAE